MERKEQAANEHVSTFGAKTQIFRRVAQLAAICTSGFLAQPAAAGYLTSYTATFPDPGGNLVTDAACSGTDCQSFTNVTGTDSFIGFANNQVTASSDLRDGTLRISASDRTGAGVQYADELTFTILGLGLTEMATVTFVIRMDGTYARATGQLIGQGNFSFNASSFGSFNAVNGGASYRTLSSSNSVNSTAAPEVFVPFATAGDWQQLATNLFKASIDIIGSDPTLRFGMSMGASGPADFSNTGELRLLLPDGATFTSASGSFLSAIGPTGNSVPEPSSIVLTASAVASMLCRRFIPAGRSV